MSVIDPLLVEVILSRVIDDALDQFPWDGGHRVDLYRAVAAELLNLAHGLEESNSA